MEKKKPDEQNQDRFAGVTHENISKKTPSEKKRGHKKK